MSTRSELRAAMPWVIAAVVVVVGVVIWLVVTTPAANTLPQDYRHSIP